MEFASEQLTAQDAAIANAAGEVDRALDEAPVAAFADALDNASRHAERARHTAPQRANIGDTRRALEVVSKHLLRRDGVLDALKEAIASARSGKEQRAAELASAWSTMASLEERQTSVETALAEAEQKHSLDDAKKALQTAKKKLEQQSDDLKDVQSNSQAVKASLETEQELLQEARGKFSEVDTPRSLQDAFSTAESCSNFQANEHSEKAHELSVAIEKLAVASKGRDVHQAAIASARKHLKKAASCKSTQEDTFEHCRKLLAKANKKRQKLKEKHLAGEKATPTSIEGAIVDAEHALAQRQRPLEEATKRVDAFVAEFKQREAALGAAKEGVDAVEAQHAELRDAKREHADALGRHREQLETADALKRGVSDALEEVASTGIGYEKFVKAKERATELQKGVHTIGALLSGVVAPHVDVLCWHSECDELLEGAREDMRSARQHVDGVQKELGDVRDLDARANRAMAKWKDTHERASAQANAAQVTRKQTNALQQLQKLVDSFESASEQESALEKAKTEMSLAEQSYTSMQSTLKGSREKISEAENAQVLLDEQIAKVHPLLEFVEQDLMSGSGKSRARQSVDDLESKLQDMSSRIKVNQTNEQARNYHKQHQQHIAEAERHITLTRTSLATQQRAHADGRQLLNVAALTVRQSNGLEQCQVNIEATEELYTQPEQALASTLERLSAIEDPCQGPSAMLSEARENVKSVRESHRKQERALNEARARAQQIGVGRQHADLVGTRQRELASSTEAYARALVEVETQMSQIESQTHESERALSELRAQVDKTKEEFEQCRIGKMQDSLKPVSQHVACIEDAEQKLDLADARHQEVERELSESRATITRYEQSVGTELWASHDDIAKLVDILERRQDSSRRAIATAKAQLESAERIAESRRAVAVAQEKLEEKRQQLEEQQNGNKEQANAQYLGQEKGQSVDLKQRALQIEYKGDNQQKTLQIEYKGDAGENTNPEEKMTITDCETGEQLY